MSKLRGLLDWVAAARGRKAARRVATFDAIEMAKCAPSKYGCTTALIFLDSHRKEDRISQLNRWLLILLCLTAKALIGRNDQENAMLRGQTAPLSPNEELTLRRVALRSAPAAELSQRDLDRIEALGLITRSDDDVALTPLGKMRYEALPRATRIDDPDENFIEMLKACVVQLRK
jgi:hypothetical protein